MDTKFCMAGANERVQPTLATRYLCNTNRWLFTTFFFTVALRDRFINLIMFVSTTKTCAELTARTSVLQQRLVNKTQQTSAQSCEWTSWFEPSPRKPADFLPPSTAKSITQILLRLCIFDLFTRAHHFDARGVLAASF